MLCEVVIQRINTDVDKRKCMCDVLESTFSNQYESMENNPIVFILLFDVQESEETACRVFSGSISEIIRCPCA